MGKLCFFYFSAGTSRQQAAKKSQQAVSALGSLGPGQSQTSGPCSKDKSLVMLRSDDFSKNDALSRRTSNSTMPVSPTTESEARSSPQQNGYVFFALDNNGVNPSFSVLICVLLPEDRMSSDQVARWKSLRRKTNR